jgi:hypothetical protein
LKLFYQTLLDIFGMIGSSFNEEVKYDFSLP